MCCSDAPDVAAAAAVLAAGAAREYAGHLPTSHPLLSPIHAPPSLLAQALGHTPLLLAVGGGEVLLGENLRFAQVRGGCALLGGRID